MKKRWQDVWASDESWKLDTMLALKGRPLFSLRNGCEYGTGVMGFARPSDGLMSKEMVECSLVDNVSVCICFSSGSA